VDLNKNKELEDFKIQYNKILQREKKAEVFLDKATEEQYEKWYPEFLKITKELSIMIIRYEEIAGVKMKEDEIHEGFKIE
jgi:hypothetical protein